MISAFTKLTLAACLLIASLSAWAVCDTQLLRKLNIEYSGPGFMSIYAAQIDKEIAKDLKNFTIKENVGLAEGRHTSGEGDDLVTVTVSEDGKSARVECKSLPSYCGYISITDDQDGKIEVSDNCSQAHKNLNDLEFNKVEN